MTQFNRQPGKNKSKVRERIQKRRERRETISNIASEGLERLPDVDLTKSNTAISTALTVIQDTLWHLRKDLPVTLMLKATGGFIAILATLFLLTTLFSREIGPGVSTMNLILTGQTVEEATETLFTYWNEDASIDILVEGILFETVKPNDIGINLDATATAQAAKDAGLSGLVFGKEIEPIITANYSDVQTYILGIGNEVYLPPVEASYRWEDGQLVSVQGSPSREIQVNNSIQLIFDDPLAVVMGGSVELATFSTQPNVVEADPYYSDALSFVSSNFIIEGYDPFRDEVEPFQTSRTEMADWLVVTDNGLSIDYESMEDFISLVNQRLDVQNWSRYLDPNETVEAVSDALITNQTTADVRIRYADSTYTIQPGDWGLRLSRRIGLPIFNIATANPGLDLNTLFAGDDIAVPSRDLVIPIEPVEGKRIVVDLESRYLVAFEGDEIVYDWAISEGREDAPTLPGVYQILSKVDEASGSSFSLCNDNAECGQWEMDHFMGIYEVGVGLTNGFHGTVRLPNGGTLTRGSSQLASTFGCVMSDALQAELLYNWAETGIVVELIDSDFPPESELGQRAQEFIRNRA